MRYNITEATRTVRNHKNRDKSAEAEERGEKSKQQSNAERINILDERLGVGVGAVKERQRLSK